MKDNLKVLYIGSLATWCNSFRRYKALTNICTDTDAINTDPYILPKYISGIQHHFNVGPGIYLLNRRVRIAIRNKQFAILLVDNKSYLTANTLRYIKKLQPSVQIASLLTDDPFGKFTKSWKLLKRNAPLYDIFFVQRTVNIGELKERGARRVEICYRSFDPQFDRPVELPADDLKYYHAKVGFVGTYENIRASYIAYLIQNNMPITVIGNDWPGGEYWETIKPFYREPSVFEEKYIKTINGMEIALHFLRHGNRDEQDSRTFEIPACKVFMIAERSALHEQLFKEDEEAVFFSTKEELLQKVKFYMSHEQKREQIALSGYNRCFESGYTHEERMKAVIDKILD